MFACISELSFENLTFKIDTRKGPFEVDRHLIARLMDIPVNEEGIPIHTLAENPQNLKIACQPEIYVK